MNEISQHLDSIATDLVAGWIATPLAAVFTWLYRRKAGSSKFRWIWLVVAGIFFVVFVDLAIRTHNYRGFPSGLQFTIYCEMSLLLAVVFAYPFAVKYLKIGAKRLDWAKNYPQGAGYEWKTYHTDGRSAGISPSPKALNFRTQITGSDHEWANMQIEFAETRDFHVWSGISFDLRCNRVYHDTTTTVQISTAEDSRYLPEQPVQAHSQNVIFSFQEMVWATWSEPSSKGYFDLRQVQRIAVVCYTACDDVEFTVSNFALLKTTVNS